MGQLIHDVWVGDELRFSARDGNSVVADVLQEITVRVLEAKGKRCKLGIRAPETVLIDLHPTNGVKLATS